MSSQRKLDFLKPYANKVESYLIEVFDKLGKKDALLEACQYSVLDGGKRIRPILTLLTAEALGNGLDVLPSACAIEIFHCASLIADDLPCMDDEEFRRGKLACHRVYGEATALMASYSLVAEAYRQVVINSELITEKQQPQAQERGFLALKCVSDKFGFQGASGGQFLDLFPPDKSLKTLDEIFLKKTGSLFEAAFVLGWSLGGGPLSEIDRVMQLARHYGFAFQVHDDIHDLEEDRERGCEFNYVLKVGEEKAYLQLNKELKAARVLLKELDIYSQEFEQVLQLLEKKKSRAKQVVTV